MNFPLMPVMPPPLYSTSTQLNRSCGVSHGYLKPPYVLNFQSIKNPLCVVYWSLSSDSSIGIHPATDRPDSLEEKGGGLVGGFHTQIIGQQMYHPTHCCVVHWSRPGLLEDFKNSLSQVKRVIEV